VSGFDGLSLLAVCHDAQHVVEAVSEAYVRARQDTLGVAHPGLFGSALQLNSSLSCSRF
jgi:hypothetical protein